MTGCLEDETEDFTSGSFYPEAAQQEEEEEEPDPVEEPEPDTTTVEAPPELCWDSVFTTTRDAYFIDLFTRYGDGWTGGDATYSILLPDGRTLWIFADTFLGTVNEDRSRPATGLINNSFVIQDGDQLTTMHGGTPSNPSSLITPATPGSWYWPTDATIYNDTLQLLLQGFRSTPDGGQFGFEYTSIDLGLFTLPDLELIEIQTKIPEPDIAYGSCVLESSDYIYIYGTSKAGGDKFANIARAADGDMRNNWEYYNGSDWVPDVEESAALFNTVVEQYAVFEDNGRYYLVTHENAFGDEIYILDAPDPLGPWGNQRTLYCTPETGNNIFTYNSFVHPQFTENDELLISYNNNSFDYFELFENADNYRPHFIRVGNWR
jgi:hypothetical protein